MYCKAESEKGVDKADWTDGKWKGEEGGTREHEGMYVNFVVLGL